MVMHKDTNLPPGYKKTEVGVIPEEWEVVNVQDIAQVKGGKRLPKGFQLEDEPTPHPYIRVSDMYFGGIDISNIKYVPIKAYPAIRQYRIFTEDIFISVAGTLGLVGVVPEELNGANLSENADRITNITCDQTYLMYWLMSNTIQKQIEAIKTIGAQPKLALARIAKFQIALPKDKSEQRAIARVLSDVDALLELLDALIEKKCALKTAAMQQLLTGKMRLPGFTGEWVTRRLGEVADLYQPVTISSKNFKEFGFPVYGANGVVGYYDKTNHKSWQVIVTCRGSTCGTVNRTIDKCWITGNAMVLNVDHNIDIDKEFFYHLMKNQDLSSCITGTGQPQIVRGPLAAFPVRLPKEKNEQRAIATVLSDIDAEIAALEAQREKVRQVKQGMMQVLLTGKVRLVGETEKELQNT